MRKYKEMKDKTDNEILSNELQSSVNSFINSQEWKKAMNNANKKSMDYCVFGSMPMNRREEELIGTIENLKATSVENEEVKKDPIYMDNEVVAKTINDRIERTTELLQIKGFEYIRNGDRLHNFRTAAKLNNTTMETALHGFLTKHLVSYMDMLDDIENGKIPSEATVKEKMGDIIVYFHLQEAVMMTRIKNNAK